MANAAEPVNMPGPQRSARDLRAQRVPRSNAPSVAQPQGLTQRVILNALEVFFKRPLLHLAPLAMMLVLGIFTAFNAPQEYKSVGVMNVTSGSLLEDISQAQNTPVFGFDPPATVTARSLNNLISVRSFMEDVLARARLTTAVEQGLLTVDELRASITVSPNGDNLVAVWAVSPRPEQSQLLAGAILDAFREYNVQNDIADAETTIAFRARRIDEFNERFRAAADARSQWLAENPAPLAGDRPTAEESELASLTEELTRARTQLSDGEAALDDARIAMEQARSISERKLRIVDAPLLPTSPEPRLKGAVLSVAMFAVMGLILSLGLVLINAFLDHSVRVPGDITARFGVDVPTVVPEVRRMREAR